MTATMATTSTKQPDNLASVPTEELRGELATCLGLTAHNLTRAGLVWAELERRGEDLSDLRQGLGQFLPLIACGRLAAEAVVAFAGRPPVLRALEGLPLAEQRRLAAGGTIEVIVHGDTKRTESVPLARLTSDRLCTVFDGGAILTPAEQRSRLKPQRALPAKPIKHFTPKVVCDGGVLKTGNVKIPIPDALSAIAATRGPDRPIVLTPETPSTAYESVTAILTHEERQQLKEHAEKSGRTERELIRLALRAYGLIG